MNLCRQVANIITTDQIVRHADYVIKSTETDDGYAALIIFICKIIVNRNIYRKSREMQ